MNIVTSVRGYFRQSFSLSGLSREDRRGTRLQAQPFLFRRLQLLWNALTWAVPAVAMPYALEHSA